MTMFSSLDSYNCPNPDIEWHTVDGHKSGNCRKYNAKTGCCTENNEMCYRHGIFVTPYKIVKKKGEIRKGYH